MVIAGGDEGEEGITISALANPSRTTPTIGEPREPRKRHEWF